MASLANGSSMLVRYGPGGDGNRPERLRWMIIYNSSGSTMFIPENSAAERSAMWSYFPYRYNPDPAYGVTSTKKLYNNVAQIGNGPCWNNALTVQTIRLRAGVLQVIQMKELRILIIFALTTKM